MNQAMRIGDRDGFALALEASHQGLWAWDIATGEVRYSPSFATALGYADGEFPTDIAGFEALVHPDDLPTVRRAVERHLAERTPYAVEFRLRHRDGRWRWFEARGQVTRDETGWPVCMAGCNLDIEERVAASRVIRRQAALLAEAQRLARLGTWEYDVATGAIAWSLETYRMFGMDPLQGPPTLDRYVATVHPDDRAALLARIEACLTEGTPYSVDHRVVAADGAVTFIEAAGEALRDATGRVTTLHGSVIDVTERKRTEIELRTLREQAEAGSRAKADFLAHASHELRTPMNGVLGMLDLLLETPLAPAQRQYALTAHGAADTLLRLLNDLLDLSKIEAGKLELESVAFAPRATIGAVGDLMAERARQRGLAFAVILDPALPAALRGDSLRLRQVLLNLIGNAIKFTPRGEVVVRVQVDRQDDDGVTVRVAVSDTGPGISAADRQRLFQPFAQAGSAAARAEGTGLGLSICRQLVGLMGGEIGVDSTPGAGSTFWFTARFLHSSAPLAAADADEGPRAAPPRFAAGSRVLLVDDHPVNRLVAIRMLEPLGCRVDIATTGAEAVQAFRRASYDLVFMDCQMPEMDGYAATRLIREHEEVAGRGPTPVVAMTANAMRGDRERCLAAGMDDHVTKPIDRRALVAAVQRWLDPVARAATASTPAAPTRPPAATPAATALAPLVHDLANALQAWEGDRMRALAGEVAEAARRAGRGSVMAAAAALATAMPRSPEEWDGAFALHGDLQRALDAGEGE